MFNPVEVENEILEYWNKNNIYEYVKEKRKENQKFFYLDGPPYTTGKIHIGHAWGKALRDMIMRYKRMRGFNVLDQPGFDMHGLPIEVEVEKALNLKTKKDIETKVGVDKFIAKCKEFALNKMYPMIEDFKRMGVWMDFDKPYMTIDDTYIENLWWSLKKAFEKKLLYSREVATTWCPRCETALAKHELDYETRTEDSIFVKMPIRDEENSYFVVWTTTPWTIPFNLAIMANPEFEYVKAKVYLDDNNYEYWILAKGLSAPVISAVAGLKFEIVDEFLGSTLKGKKYDSVFSKDIPEHKEIEKRCPNAFTILLSEEFVDLTSGSGLVHCAPGCGPEDYLIGKKNKIEPFNYIDDSAKFPDNSIFKGLYAKKDDKEFVSMIEKKGNLVATSLVEHEYAHCWRCKSAIVYKTTTQWFLSVTEHKEKILKDNDDVLWVPKWGGANSFKSWLKNLNDWCISRQRYWGTPLPIWICENGHIHVVGSRKELTELTKKEVTDIHKPAIDDFSFKCKECGKEMKRIPDVLDVWLDSGVASFASLDYVNNPEKFNKNFPADFILEGKDQIRGWFNSLFNMSEITFDKKAFSAVYMHGMINDLQGRKMSKSIKNIISPYEVFDKYGADSFRYYSIGGAKPGNDLNYNFDDLKVKFRNLGILWNIKEYLKSMYSQLTSENIQIDDGLIFENMDIEEKYIISKINSSLKKITNHLDVYELDDAPDVAEEALLELSRGYIQIIRDKSVYGKEIQKKHIFKTVLYCYKKIVMMFAPIIPFVSEKIYLDLKEFFKDSKFSKDEHFSFEKISIHDENWPKFNDKLINSNLEEEFLVLQKIVQKILSLREKVSLGIRWPMQKVLIDSKKKLSKDEIEIIKNLVNIKEIGFGKEKAIKRDVKINVGKIAQKTKEKTPEIIAKLNKVNKDKIAESLLKNNKYELEEFEFGNECFTLTLNYPENIVATELSQDELLVLYLDRSEELINEGYVRELMRRIQDLRKEEKLKKEDKITLVVSQDQDVINTYEEMLLQKIGASEIKYNDKHFANKTEFKIKDLNFIVSFEVNK